MATRYYVGIAEPGPNNWSISFPAFPGVITVGDTLAALVAHVSDALACAIEAMEADGAVIPEEFTGPLAATIFDPADYANPHAVLVPVEVSGRSMRINVTMDDGLLTRLDGLARRSHASRSALLARGARMVLAAETPD